MGGMSLPGVLHDLCDTHGHAAVCRGGQPRAAVGQDAVSEYLHMPTSQLFAHNTLSLVNCLSL